MIKKESFTKEHIQNLRESNKRDPILLERAVYAFGLLEALRRVDLPFIFKGGTCLLLLLDPPRRLSTDIDIVVAPGTKMNDYLKKASKIFPFRSVEEQKRVGKNSIVKSHYKFTYDSPTNGKPLYILLDVLFEDNQYTRIVDREIRNELLLTEPEYTFVETPSVDCILADKLTAFAPHTSGIPLNEGKDKEVLKQFYDVCSLLSEFTDFEDARDTYYSIAQKEINYRGIDIRPEDCLRDSFNAGLCLASKGKAGSKEFASYVKGIRELRGHVFEDNYTPEIASVNAPAVMYLTMCLLTGNKFTKVENASEYSDRVITNAELSSLRYLRKVSQTAYAYVIKTDELISI